MGKLLEFLGDACILAFSVFSLFVFYKIAAHGYVRLVEPNGAILGAEIAVALIIGIVGLERLLDDLLWMERTPTFSAMRWRELWRRAKEWYNHVG